MSENEKTMQVMIIKTSGMKYLIPLSSIKQSFKAAKKDLLKDPNGNEMLTVNGKVYNLLRMCDFFGTKANTTEIEDGIIIMLESGRKIVCALADELIGEQPIAVKPLPEYAGELKGINGCSLLDEDEIALSVNVIDFFDNVSESEYPDDFEEAPEAEQKEDIFADPVSAADSTKDRYFTFRIDNEEYGIEVANIKEIISDSKVTGLPGTPDYFKGIMTLRGDIIPVVDVKRRFGMQSSGYSGSACIVVVECMQHIVGLVVDEVREVVLIENENVLGLPEATRKIHNEYVRNLGKVDEKVIFLLDLDKFLL